MLTGTSALQFEQTRQIVSPRVELSMDGFMRSLKTINGGLNRINTYKPDFYWGDSYLNVLTGDSTCGIFRSIPYSDIYGSGAVLNQPPPVFNGVTHPGVTFALAYESGGPFKMIQGTTGLGLYYGKDVLIMGTSYSIAYRTVNFDGSNLSGESILTRGTVAGVTFAGSTVVGGTRLFLYPITDLNINTANGDIVITELENQWVPMASGSGTTNIVGTYKNTFTVKRAYLNGSSYTGLTTTGITMPMFDTGDINDVISSTWNKNYHSIRSTLEILFPNNKARLFYIGLTSSTNGYKASGGVDYTYLADIIDLNYDYTAIIKKERIEEINTTFPAAPLTLLVNTYAYNNQEHIFYSMLAGSKKVSGDSTAGVSSIFDVTFLELTADSYRKRYFPQVGSWRTRATPLLHAYNPGNPGIAYYAYDYNTDQGVSFLIYSQELTGRTMNLFRYRNSNNSSFNFTISNTDVT